MIERRDFQRIKYSTTSTLKVEGTPHPGDLLDISLKGALLQFDSPPPIDEAKTYDLEIHLPASDITLNFEVMPIHSGTGNEYGFKFVGQDIETITHLRRLLELNIGDGDELDREMSTWLKS